MVKIGIISDTHVSEKRGKLNEKIFEYFQDVDLIFHAGDITSPKVLDELSTIAPITAVKGNNDKFELENTEFISVNSFQILLNHGTNFSANFDQLYEFSYMNLEKNTMQIFLSRAILINLIWKLLMTCC